MITNTLVKVVEESSAFLEANLPAGYTTADIEYPNIPRQTPNGEQWIRSTWTNTGPISKDANNCYVITEGIWALDFIVPKGTGDIHAISSAEEFKELLSSDGFEDFWVEDATVFPLPEEENWYVVRLEITYQYEGFNDANHS